MDTQKILASSIAQLEEILKGLDESAEDIDIMREGIKTTLERAKIRASRTTMAASSAPTNGYGLPESADRFEQTNAEIVAKYLSGYPSAEFSVVTTWRGFQLAYPSLLKKRQFQAAFQKLAKRHNPPLVLVQRRPGNVPNIYRWIDRSEESRNGDLTAEE